MDKKKKQIKGPNWVCPSYLRNAGPTNHERVMIGRAWALGVTFEEYKAGIYSHKDWDNFVRSNDGQ